MRNTILTFLFAAMVVCGFMQATRCTLQHTAQAIAELPRPTSPPNPVRHESPFVQAVWTSAYGAAIAQGQAPFQARILAHRAVAGLEYGRPGAL
jgi:hypothetical protein